jgi:predicted component of type VI protein secretion system
MGFGAAFFNSRMPAGDETGIGLLVGVLMQAVAPQPKVPGGLNHVLASNLCFGVQMNWALNDADRHRQVCQTLRHKLEVFEPRLVVIRQVEMHEDEVGNRVEFTVHGEVRIDSVVEEIELKTGLSLFDQQVDEAHR